MNRAIAVVAILVGALYVANGVYMLAAPESWYWAVPGVPDRGPFNQHFIRDVGIVYVLCGAGLLAGLVYPHLRRGLWPLAAIWPAGHALFHVAEVLAGICGPEALVQDFAGVFAPALLGLWIALDAWRRAPVGGGPVQAPGS